MKKLISIFFTLTIFSLSSMLNAQDPLVYFPFCGDADDISGNNNNGVVTGASLTEDRFENINSAYYFDGVDDRINFTLSPNPALMSMSCWFNAVDASINGPLVSTNGAGGLTVNTGSVGMGLEIGFGDYNNQITVPIESGEWYHIGITYDGAEVRYFFNGSQVHITYDTDAIDYDGAGFFVGCNFSQDNFYNGKVDDIMIYDYAIDSLDMVNQYYQGLCYETEIIYEYIAVTDTLIIDVTLTDLTPPDNTNTIKVYPNPASDYVIINNGDYASMSGYDIKIMNTLSQIVWETEITQQEYQIDINTFGDYGTYFISIYDNLGTLLDVRKLILE